MFAPAVRRLRGRARERRRHASLTGAWSGAYGYALPFRRDVPFLAALSEADGVLSGSIDEPNTFAPAAVEQLFATLSGSRVGASVSFVKTYDGTGGVTHAVSYEGEVNQALTRIDGTWRIGREFNGPFFMERAVAAEEPDEREAETDV